MKENQLKFEDALGCIANNLENDISACGPGLMGGKTGIALFLFYYSRYKENQDLYL